MTWIDALKENGMKLLDHLYEWFFRFKKTRAFKISCIALAAALAAAYGTGLYLNGRQQAEFLPENVVYKMGDRIAFGENYMGMYTTADGYFITFTDACAIEFDDYMDEHAELDRSEIIKWLSWNPDAEQSPYPYLVVLNAVLENESCTENWEQRIDSRELTLFCEDWFSGNLIDITFLLNKELNNSYYFFAPPGEQTELTFVFGFNERSFDEKTWENIGEKDVRLNLTYGPELIDVQFELERR